MIKRLYRRWAIVALAGRDDAKSLADPFAQENPGTDEFQPTFDRYFAPIDEKTRLFIYLSMAN